MHRIGIGGRPLGQNPWGAFPIDQHQGGGVAFVVMATSGPSSPPVDDTLRTVAAGYRLVVWVWMVILVVVEMVSGGTGNKAVLATGMALATAWLGITLWASRSSDLLGSRWFVLSDGVIALALSAVGLLAGTSDFVSGGWPGSWLFVVAFAANLRWTMAAGLVLVASHVVLHQAHGLPVGRTAGTFQFIALALVIGWAFDGLRQRDRLRLAAEDALAEQNRNVARHEERLRLADHLHDSVLQTLHAIRVDADSADEVRYLARRQERELRRTIEEFRSPFADSFKARLLRYRDEVEDLCRGVQIVDVVRDDAPVTPALEVALNAAREGMMNAGKHSGSSRVDLYSEVTDGWGVIHVRDRGRGFDTSDIAMGGLRQRIIESVRGVGGEVDVVSRPGEGAEITIRVPCR